MTFKSLRVNFLAGVPDLYAALVIVCADTGEVKKIKNIMNNALIEKTE